VAHLSESLDGARPHTRWSVCMTWPKKAKARGRSWLRR
jgi:hypothetical protein